jgi:GTPase SAR1 family protein
MILYSVADQSSFDNAQTMRKKIERAKDVESFPMVLVGNKCDLANKAILTERGAAKAQEMGCPFVETSAKAGVCVVHMMILCLGRILLFARLIFLWIPCFFYCFTSTDQRQRSI